LYFRVRRSAILLAPPSCWNEPICTPASTPIGRHRRAQDLKPDLRNSRLPDVGLLGRRQRKVDDSPFYKRTAVGNPHHRRMTGFDVCHSHRRSEGERAMSRRQAVHIENLAIRTAAFMIRRAVPTGFARFDRKRLYSFADAGRFDCLFLRNCSDRRFRRLRSCCLGQGSSRGRLSYGRRRRWDNFCLFLPAAARQSNGSEKKTDVGRLG